MTDALIVSLDEFAELASVTSETMRVHLRELGKDGSPIPDWLIERGDRGRAYKIEAEGAIAWWQAKRDADEQHGADRQARLQQLRFETIGDVVDKPEQLTLSGRQRREEYAAAMDGIKYRKMLGHLVERADVERVITTAAVEHRRSLQQLPAEFGIAVGLSTDQQRKLEAMIEQAVDKFVTAIAKPDAFAPR